MSGTLQLQQWLDGDITATDKWLRESVAELILETKTLRAENKALSINTSLYRRSQARVTQLQEVIDLQSEKLTAESSLTKEWGLPTETGYVGYVGQLTEEEAQNLSERDLRVASRFVSPWLDI